MVTLIHFGEMYEIILWNKILLFIVIFDTKYIFCLAKKNFMIFFSNKTISFDEHAFWCIFSWNDRIMVDIVCHIQISNWIWYLHSWYKPLCTLMLCYSIDAYGQHSQQCVPIWNENSNSSSNSTESKFWLNDDAVNFDDFF